MLIPIPIADQLRPLITGLRKQRGLTQAQLAALLGVHQTRVAEIERNPGSVSVEQFLRLLQSLDARLVLEVDTTPVESDLRGEYRVGSPQPKGEW